MYVLNARDGKPKRTWSGVQAPLTSADCNRSGTLAVCGTSTSRVLVRRMPDGQFVADFNDHDDVVPAEQFSPDDRLLATGCEDDTARLWQLPPLLCGNTDQIIEQIERHCGMRLTNQGYIETLK